MSVVSKKQSWVKQCNSPVILYGKCAISLPSFCPQFWRTFLIALGSHSAGLQPQICLWDGKTATDNWESRECRPQDTHRTFLMLCMALLFYFFIQTLRETEIFVTGKIFPESNELGAGEPGRAEIKICHTFILMCRPHLSSSSPIRDGSHEQLEGYHSTARPPCFDLSIQTVLFCFWLAHIASRFHNS